MSPVHKAARAVRAHPRWSLLIAVLVVGGSVGGYFAASGSNTPAQAASTTTTQTVSMGTIKQSVSASGTLAPGEDDSLTFSSSGVVTAVAVKQGQTVKKGQTLATINSASLAATVAQDKATLASDEAKVDDDETNDVSSTQLVADKAAVTAAKNQLASAKTALAGATMTSPINGVVAAINLTVGQSVSGSGSTAATSATASNSFLGTTSSTSSSTSSADIEVISTNSWIVNATVDASSVGMIKPGNQAQLAITGNTSTVYGTISSISVLSSSSSGTASYSVVIAVTGSPAGLHDGQNVTATLVYKQLTNVIEVPTLALHRASSGGEYVNKLVNGQVVQTTVRVGISCGAETHITSGLTVGDKIQVQQIVPTRAGTGTGTGTIPGGGTFPGGGSFPGGGAFPGAGAFPGGGLGG